MDDAAEAITAAVRATAPAMSALSGALEIALVESELACVFALALRTTGKPWKVGTEHRVDFPGWQPRVGEVDVTLVDATTREPHAFIELKWGAATLYNCIWDLGKMATAVAGGHVPRAFLVAGASEAAWAGAAGREVFDERAWKASDLFARDYLPGWKKWWEEVKTRPQLLPAEMITREIARAAMTINGLPWSLRAAEVTLTRDYESVPVPTDYPSAEGWSW